MVVTEKPSEYAHRKESRRKEGDFPSRKGKARKKAQASGFFCKPSACLLIEHGGRAAQTRTFFFVLKRGG